MNLDTSNRTYRQLVGNGLIYSVPRFQRDYSWTATEWEDLWQDMESLFDEEAGETDHYMGYLVLQSKNSKNFDVIDGQQRLTTLSILILAFLGNLRKLIDEGIDPDRNQQRLDQLRNTFIGYLDPVTLIPQSKLNLNRNNDDFYQRYLVPLEAAPKRGLKATEHLMRKAYDWFFSTITQKFSNNRTGSAIAQYIDAVSDKLFFTVITVSDELNAYKVFETLNARGVKLSSTDLLKNYLFSVVHKNGSDEYEMTELEDRWERLGDLIGSESLPDFLRTYWNSKEKLVRHSELFKRIREGITIKGEVFSLIRDLDRKAHIFAALPNSEDALWTAEQKKYIKTLKMFNVRQIYPLLLSAYEKFPENDFCSLLKACCVISLRYNIIGNLPANEQERIYNKLAVELSNNRIYKLQELIAALANSNLYVSDKKFKSDFANKELRTTQSSNKRVVRYILFSLEKHISNKHYDFESDSYNLEHIMPESIQEGWDSISDQDHENFMYRLGNMTLLNKSVNRDLGNADFMAKRRKYAMSEFSLTQRISKENDQCNPERIAEHQTWMAHQATAIWRIDTHS